MPNNQNYNYDQAPDPQAYPQGQSYSGTYDMSGGYYQTDSVDYSNFDGYDSYDYSDPVYQEEYYAAPPEKKRGAGFYAGISLAAIALVAGIGIGVFLFMNSTQIVPTHRSGELGQLDGKTKEEIQAELDRVVQEGMFNIAIANVVQLANGSSEGDFSIENSPANHYNMQVDISLVDTGEVIYTSGILEPNYHVQYAKLDKPLSKGTYNCIATFHALDPKKDGAEVGSASAAMTIVVLN